MTAKRPSKAVISLVRTADRTTGIPRVIDLARPVSFSNRNVLVKPNFNTADPFPGSTHNDTLRALLLHLRALGAGTVTVADRCGPGDTAAVLKEKGVDRLCAELGAGLVNLEDLHRDQWVKVQPEGSHWRSGFFVARPVREAECVVATCCLKTHGYGGVFTMSLKLAVGITHKRNMTELHTSLLAMRKMIAEINVAYTPSLVVLDGIEAFTDRGPMTGPRKRADVLLAGTDRVAIDAVGLAVLKLLGSNKTIMEKRIFEHEQIARAVELGLGVARPEDIELVTGDDASRDYAERLREVLLQG